MSKLSVYISSQCANPRGPIGKGCCMVMNVINNMLYRRTLSLLKLNKASNILDIGYGNGYLIELIYKKFHPNIYGVDISEDMLNTASKKNFRANRDGKLHLTVGNCCNLPYQSDFFDAVTSINTIYFWDDTATGMKEIKRTLKTGCSFYNAVYTKEWLQKLSYTKTGFKFFEIADYVNLGKEAGFSEVTVKDVVKGKSLVVIYTK